MAILELGTDNKIKRDTSADPDRLRRHLADIKQLEPDADTRTTKRIYLLEGLNPGFIDPLGSHFNLDPSMFKKQERTCVFSSEHEWANDNVALPTSRGSSYMHLRYFVVLNFGKHLPKLNSLQVSCADTGRHIGVNRMLDEIQPNAAVRRKTSMWSRKYKGGGWDVIILCDPRVRALVHGTERKVVEVKDADHPDGAVAFQGGFVDFVPHEDRPLKSKGGPPRTCLMDDFMYYFDTYAGQLDTTRPECASLLVKKLVAAHLHEFFSYMRGLVYHHAWLTQPRRQGFTEEDLRISEDHWGVAQGLSLRVTQYVEDVENNFVELGMSFDSTDAGVADANSTKDKTGAYTWQKYEADYRNVYQRLKDLQARADLLGQSLNGLASMAAYRLAQEDASRAQGLTFVGLLFIPLAYVSGLFSMSDAYRPGSDLFWVYFAVSIPAVVLVLIAAYLSNRSFRRDLKVYPRRFQKWWTRSRSKPGSNANNGSIVHQHRAKTFPAELGGTSHVAVSTERPSTWPKNG